MLLMMNVLPRTKPLAVSLRMRRSRAPARTARRS